MSDRERGTAGPSSSRPDPSSAPFFDRMYAADADPWDFASSPYELRRYDSILEHVDAAVHRTVFEPGCSIGVLTERLARRCATVHATDISPVAVGRARERCRHLSGVRIEVGTLHPPPHVRFDLAVVSEVGYYSPAGDLARQMAALVAQVRPAGRLIAAHWLGRSPDHVLHGDDVHAVIETATDGWMVVHRSVHRSCDHVGFRIDVWDRP